MQEKVAEEGNNKKKIVVKIKKLNHNVVSYLLINLILSIKKDKNMYILSFLILQF